MTDEPHRERNPFSLTEGGPFFHLLTHLRLRTPASMVRSWWLAVLLWFPLLIDAGARALLGVPSDPMMHDVSLHVRLLITLPVLLSSEILLEACARSGMTSFYNGKFCDRARIDPILQRAEQLRDAWVVEAVLLGVAILGGQLVLWGVFGATGLFHGGGATGAWSFPRLWYAIIALPLIQFVMFRWLWRWVIWTYVVARISRLPLASLATHSDLAAGLGPLVRPVTGFSGFVLAISAILSAAWATQLLDGRTTIKALLPMLVAFLVGSLAIAVGPLLPLCGHLFRARRRGLAQYGDFMRAYTLRFHEKWIAAPRSEVPQALGSTDIQSLADLGQSYQVVLKTRVLVFGPRTVFTVWFAGLLPMIPLFASTLTVEHVLQRILRTVLGGFPL